MVISDTQNRFYHHNNPFFNHYILFLLKSNDTYLYFLPQNNTHKPFKTTKGRCFHTYPLPLFVKFVFIDEKLVPVFDLSYTYTFNGFQERGRVDIQSLEDGLQVNVLLLGLSVMAVLGQHYQITVIPL